MSVRGEGYGDDRLPWLETVEDEYRAPRTAPVGRIVALGALLLIILAAAAGAFYWYRHQATGGNGELIQAPPGDYKVKPDEPGGMKVEGEGDTVFATSQGAASNSSINVGALPEAPVEGKVAPKASSGAPATKTAKIEVPSASAVQAGKPAAAQIAAGSPGSGSLIQLGAFPNEAGANIAWARISKRFAYLAPLGKSVERAEKDGKAIFRLRVNAGSNTQARELCGRLKVAGENCYVTS
ncbi:SPOR domain-containing protein [Sphingomonas sp. MMS12-HWE2-04]|uniref:SPOR domain-containing protein n=1 Tax=Sphingomonas sp. MMS12-HWE2-04 TaxID=3234199 RepID=UPI00384B6215